MSDESHSAQNASFWDELCGTNIARQLGIDDKSPSSLKKFDEWFFGFYPYLKSFIDRAIIGSNSVLEVGLGYGSVASYIAQSNYKYTGLDIAHGPVSMCQFRLEMDNLDGEARVGDALDAPFLDNSFDAVVAIGSLHHTGNFDRAIEEMCRVTKSDGVVCGMVYSLFSARNFIFRPIRTTRLAISNIKHPVRVLADERLRWFSDHNQKGEAAPSTEYFSRRALRLALEKYGDVQIEVKNLDSLPIPFGLGNRVRKLLIETKLATWFGLDIYYVIYKKDSVIK
jgi:ubiquinone/menaquinone biosynthesis C-methylase UbiE